MRVFVAGIDGYLGWALAQHLLEQGHQVAGADNLSRRRSVEEIGSWSAVRLASTSERIAAAGKAYGQEPTFCPIDICDYSKIHGALVDFAPDAVVHLGQCPSAPYSMMDVDHATSVQVGNLVSTLNLIYAIRQACPKAHLVKLGTMGEYGTPDVDIPEGEFEVTYRGRTATLPFPRQANSWYHLSKVHDSHNLAFACRTWALTVTDLMQGVVYGTNFSGRAKDEALATRLDFDAVFGTVVHRFCAQATIGKELTVYGEGRQRRGFIALADSIRCITLALQKPPKTGQYRVLNQISDVYSVMEIAETVKEAATRCGHAIHVKQLPNPRNETQDHYYHPDAKKLPELGFVASTTLGREVERLLDVMAGVKERIVQKRDVLEPTITWR